MYRPILLASVLFCLSFQSGAAQQPTTTQRDAIRSSCRSDFMAKCSGVKPGGRAALECLERNHDNLSSSCKTAIDAVAAKPAAAPASAETLPAATPNAPSAEQTPASAKANWCAIYSYDGGTNCWFETREQCMAAVSGGNGSCSPSPYSK